MEYYIKASALTDAEHRTVELIRHETDRQPTIQQCTLQLNYNKI